MVRTAHAARAPGAYRGTTSSEVRVTLTEARAALGRCDWDTARELLTGFEASDPLDEADRADMLAEALWWAGHIDECIESRRAAYAGFEEHGDARRAGQVAIWLYEHHCFRGMQAMGGAWLRRARHALEGDEQCVEWGNLLLREAEMAHGRGEIDAATGNAKTALALGRTLRSPDLEAEALQTLGRLWIDAGKPVEGMGCFDEAMLLAVEGRLGPYATGKVYCSLIGACEDLGDLRRAAEWTEATIRWSERHPFAVFPGLCRVKRAEVLQWRGEWAQAEREARRACEELASVKVNSAAAAWVEVGEIRRRIGDLDGAEDAFARAQQMCCTPAAGLALLRLAQGRVDAARAIIDDALHDQSWNRLARARLLPAKVQIAIAHGDVDDASVSADELDAIAGDYESSFLVASARVARGRVELAAGDALEAATTLRRAVDDWNELDVPYECATAQLLLAHACAASGDVTGEQRWLGSATATFDALGAAYDARPPHAPRAALPCGLTAREAEVLRLVAEGRTNKDVASHLFLSDRTVARHLSNIFTKTGVTTRAAATAFAFEQGIVERERTAPA
jgi:ATP/maltotriose-dependent transcriptional regulator MalT